MGHADVETGILTFDAIMETTTLEIEGMNCGHCVNAVKNLIEEVDGVTTAKVDLANKNAEVEFDKDTTSIQAIIENINSSNVYKAKQK